jgi:hypothetical protein
VTRLRTLLEVTSNALKQNRLFEMKPKIDHGNPKKWFPMIFIRFSSFLPGQFIKSNRSQDCYRWTLCWLQNDIPSLLLERAPAKRIVRDENPKKKMNPQIEGLSFSSGFHLSARSIHPVKWESGLLPLDTLLVADWWSTRA